MSIFFKNNDFKVGYKKGPHDEYKAAYNKLDDATKNKLEWQRTLGMVAAVVVVMILFAVLVGTGIGIDKTKSVSGNVFADKETVLIECFGDSLTEGYMINADGSSSIAENTYPDELKTRLTSLLASDGNQYTCTNVDVKNYGQSGSILQSGSCSRLSGTADIVVMQYTANNFLDNAEYVGTIEANVETMEKQGSLVFLMNYPVMSGSAYEDKLTQTNNYISSAASTENVQLIDINKYFCELTDYSTDDLFCSDGIHLTEQGYALMGDYAAEIIHDYYISTYY